MQMFSLPVFICTKKSIIRLSGGMTPNKFKKLPQKSTCLYSETASHWNHSTHQLHCN